MLSADNQTRRATVPARWLPALRLAWLAVAAAVIAEFITHFAFHSALLLVVAPAYVPGLASLGLSTTDFRTAVGILYACTMLACSAVALLMYWRKSDEWMGLVGSIALLTFGAMPTFLGFGVRVRGMWDSADMALLALATALSVITVSIFPDGRFYPRWTKLLAALMLAWALTWPFFPALATYNWPPELGGPALSVVYTLAMAAVVYRYRHTSPGAQRQQMKWVIYAFVLQIPIWIVALFALSALRGSLSVQAYSLASLIGGATVSFAQLLVPLSFAIAILRYRLWDIDLIINRTLIYVPLTGILAGVYAASIATLQRLFQAFTGQKSDAAVVLTTLLLVGIFEPVKDRLKRAVERRYREPQDPLAPIESFGNQVSHVVDVFEPSRVTQQVLQTAAAALQARGGAVYLEQDGQRRLVYVCGEWNTGEAAVELPIEAHGKRLGGLQLAARQDGTPYSARECEVLGQALSEVGLAIYLTVASGQMVDALDEW